MSTDLSSQLFTTSDLSYLQRPGARVSVKGPGSVWVEFVSNNVTLSLIWHAGAYCHNHYLKNDDFWFFDPPDSPDAEVAVWTGDGSRESSWLKMPSGEVIQGYVTYAQVQQLLDFMSSMRVGDSLALPEAT